MLMVMGFASGQCVQYSHELDGDRSSAAVIIEQLDEQGDVASTFTDEATNECAMTLTPIDSTT